ncbi:MAG TPA: zf-HC2 domain-containing protein [Polyangiaceae bacterium]|nr:zf-HC2 domain-containing protein [Polyangiaceae bacterium]
MIAAECETTRLVLHDFVRGRLPPETRSATESHLAGCGECRARLEEERITARLLETHVSRPPASDALRAKLLAELGPAEASSKPRRFATTALLALAALLVGAILLVREVRSPAEDALVNEAVNDHLRVLYAERPVEIESGGIHQVKPWFSGRLDFAPVVGFGGDGDFPLVGGSVALFVDRKAACFVFKRRLHTISLFVFRADGLSLPTVTSEELRGGKAPVGGARGFHSILFRHGDLGYALVSDVASAELVTLSERLDL